MATKTELISLLLDVSEDPSLSVCYARGQKFAKEGNFWRVEVGKRTLVHKSLCVDRYFGKRCEICPNSTFEVTVRAKDEPRS